MIFLLYPFSLEYNEKRRQFIRIIAVRHIIALFAHCRRDPVYNRFAVEELRTRGTIYMLIYMRLITMSDGAYRHALRAVPDD